VSIKGLSDRKRFTTLVRIRLGVKETNARGVEYPKETDAFMLSADDGATPEILKLYGTRTKALRLMLPFELTAVDPHSGQEIVWNVRNRAYGSGAGLKCSGDGGSDENLGAAEATDEEWAAAVSRHTGVAPTKLKNGRYQIVCAGRDCPMQAGAKKQCAQVAVFRAFLLHPTTNSGSPDYCRVLASCDLATGSFNSIVDIQSGIQLLAPFTGGRTSVIPFSLIRKPTTTYQGQKAIHWTLAVTFDPREVQRWALVPPGQAFLPEAMREDLLRLAAKEPDLDAVRDILPRLEAAVVNQSPESEPREAIGPPVASPPDPVAADRQEAVDRAEAAELERPLTQAERDEVKKLFPTVDEARDAAVKAHAHFGTAGASPFGDLQVKHARWVRANAVPATTALQGELIAARGEE
jgi:hypothetical protein